MSLVINHNMMAMNTARNLGNTYDRLSSSVQRLSSGLRINSAADDAAGLAIRELMRADISTMQQGIRNAADAISMIQTADGGMAVIDEKLVRMKELAEQAATGTYTTLQREIINSEYQAMAAEIDRIATSTNFNGVKLLDGSITNLHGGLGMKIHFGVGNSPDEDYYFINTGDVRATSNTGLRIGGDAKNDIWGQGAAGAKGLAGPGCCTAGYDSLDGKAGFTSGETFSYGYNWDWTEDDDPDLLNGRYLAGRYTVNSSDSLQDLLNKVNEGTQSRVGVKLDGNALGTAIKNGGTAAVCIGDEAYIFGSAAVAGGTVTIPAVSGVVWEYTATGFYDDAGFMFNNVNGEVGYGFGLSQAQIRKLEEAGINLSALGLTSAMVSASGISTVSSVQAKTQLTARLAQAWNAFKIGTFSALSIASGVTSGYSITSATLKAGNGAALSGVGLAAVVGTDQSLIVKTGVYADANGNWTDSARVAKALGLEEVTITLLNQGKTTYNVTISNNTYTSPNYLTGVSGGTSYAVSLTDKNGFYGAGLSAYFKFLGSAAVSAQPVTTTDSLASAQTEFLSAVQKAWYNAYSAGLTGLRFSVSAGAGIPDFDGVVIAQSALDQQAIAGGGNSASTIIDGQSLEIRTGVYVDASGNFTTSANVAALFGSRFTELVLKAENATGIDDDIIFTDASGIVITSAVIASASASTATISLITNRVDDYIDAVITARQATGPGTYGVVFFEPSHITTPPSPQTFTELEAAGAIASTVVPGANLTASVQYAGTSAALTTGPLAGLAKSTNLGDLVTAVNLGLDAFLGSLQTAGAATYSGLGRILTSLSTDPGGPSGPADVQNLNVTDRIFSGELDRSVATGTYANSGDVYAASAGYVLTSAQLAKLKSAGVNLSALHLVSAIISASAASTVSSADARVQLLAKLNQIWSAIGLANMSAISVAVGANPGTTVVSATGIVASAGVNALSGIGGASVLKEQNSLTIRTGIYADAKGNWTDDKKLASALGLAEIIYTVENNDYTAVKAQASFMNENVLTSGSLSMTSATKRAISAAGLSISQFTCANVSLSASAATSALALLKLQNDALAYWASVYGVKDNVVFTAGDNSASVPNLTVTDVTTNNVSNLEGVGAQDEILSGQTITVNTGVYIDDNGNWTQDKSLASAFGLSELVYEIERPTGANSTKYSADITYGSSAYDSPRVIFSAATYGATGVGQLASAITASIREAITYLQSQAPSPITPGLLAKSGQSQAPAPTAAQLAAAAAGNYANLPSVYTGTRNPSGSVGNLDVFFTLSGVTTIPSLGLSVGTNMTTLADALSNNLSTAIQTAQNNAKYPSPGYSAGRLLSAPPSNHGGPADETQVPDLATVDHYKQASGPQTITTTGIVDKTKHATLVASAGTAYLNASGFSNFGAWALASAINHNAASQFWAMVQPYDSQGKSADMVYIFTKKGGDFNNLLACDVADGDLASQAALQAIQFENVAANEINQSGTNFTLGGEHWGTLKPVQTKAGMGKEVWNLTINGRDVGKERDLWIAALSNGVNEINTPGLNAGIINGLDRHSFVEIQNADNGPWTGAEVRTQSSAQEALEAINDAMARKDKVRADIGALQNRLENTITNLEIQMEALQASESRISDVDVATEMTEFVRNQVLAQAAVSMLSQANSLPQMALSLLNG